MNIQSRNKSLTQLIRDSPTILLSRRKCICSEAFSKLSSQLNRNKFALKSEIFGLFSAARTVAYAKSIACSTSYALEWDESFKNNADESGRAVLGVHKAEVEMKHTNQIYTSPNTKFVPDSKELKDDVKI